MAPNDLNLKRVAGVSLVVLAVSAGVVFPALRASARNENVALTIERLRSLQRATLLYQEEQGAVPERGNYVQMHLPTLLAVTRGTLKVPEATMMCPCYRKTTASMMTSQYFDYGIDDDLSEVVDGSTPLFTTLDCNKSVKSIPAPLIPHRGLGIRIDGSLIDQTKIGDVTDPAWWGPTERNPTKP